MISVNNMGDGDDKKIRIGSGTISVSSPYIEGSRETTEKMIDTFSPAPMCDVAATHDYTGISYGRLLEIAKKMHLWIFNNTIDEESAYEEIGLSEKENEILGYMGRLVVEENGK